MSLPIAPAAPSLSPSPPMNGGANALTAPTTPGKRMPVIDKSKVNPKLLEAAQGMEAMFIDYLMKTMRDSIPKEDMDLESPATKIYRSMLDSEYAQKAAKAGGVGLADQIIAYWESQSYTGSRGVQSLGVTGQGMGQSRNTGGTHAGDGVE